MARFVRSRTYRAIKKGNLTRVVFDEGFLGGLSMGVLAGLLVCIDFGVGFCPLF